MVTIMVDKLYAGVAVLGLGLVGWLGVAQSPAPVTDDPAAPEPAAVQEAEQLRVCADPNNLPFSNREEEGFHNRLAEMFAEEMGLAGVSYTWWRQHRGFIRNTLKKNRCDVVFGVPAGYDILQPTKPFYRSPYVFLYRSDADFDVSSLDDPILRDLNIGVNLIGDDYYNPPPAHALGARGIVGNVQGFTVYGDYDEDSPPKAIVEAVARGDVELAIVWGPVAGYFGQQQDVELTMNALPAVDDSTGFPLAYNMALGVRRGEDEWKARLEKVIDDNQEEIYRILEEEYHVPLLPIDPDAPTGTTGDDDGEGPRAEASASAFGGTPGVAYSAGTDARTSGPSASPVHAPPPDGPDDRPRRAPARRRRAGHAGERDRVHGLAAVHGPLRPLPRRGGHGDDHRAQPPGGREPGGLHPGQLHDGRHGGPGGEGDAGLERAARHGAGQRHVRVHRGADGGAARGPARGAAGRRRELGGGGGLA